MQGADTDGCREPVETVQGRQARLCDGPCAQGYHQQQDRQADDDCPGIVADEFIVQGPARGKKVANLLAARQRGNASQRRQPFVAVAPVSHFVTVGGIAQGSQRALGDRGKSREHRTRGRTNQRQVQAFVADQDVIEAMPDGTDLGRGRQLRQDMQHLLPTTSKLDLDALVEVLDNGPISKEARCRCYGKADQRAGEGRAGGQGRGKPPSLSHPRCSST